MSNVHPMRLAPFTLSVTLAAVPIAWAVGFLVGANPLIPVGLGVAIAATTLFFTHFKVFVLAILIIRSSLDVFTLAGMPGSVQQIPAAFAAGIVGLTALYLAVAILRRKPVEWTPYGWILVGWLVTQAFWIVLMKVGALAFDAAFLMHSLREWVRLLSWVTIYFLILQLKGKILPQQIVNLLFLTLIIPSLMALLQMFIPSLLPPVLVFEPVVDPTLPVDGSRLRSTFGHPNSFAIYLLMFMTLTWWKLPMVRLKLPWLGLLGMLALFLVGTKTLVALVMLAVITLTLIAPRLDMVKLLGGVLIFGLVIFLFASTDFGRERLSSITETPLLNPDIDASRAILMSTFDYNSFNWRIMQWTYLIKMFHYAPWLGYGLGVSASVSTNGLAPHNDYIRALIEGGFCGFFIYLFFLLTQVVYLIQLLRDSTLQPARNRLCLCLLGILLSTLVGMINENVWSSTAFYFYWWTLMAIASWDWQEHPTGAAATAKYPPTPMRRLT